MKVRIDVNKVGSNELNGLAPSYCIEVIDTDGPDFRLWMSVEQAELVGRAASIVRGLEEFIDAVDA